jgi:hypothetical protein
MVKGIAPRGLIIDGDWLRTAIFIRGHSLRSFGLLAGVSHPTVVKACGGVQPIDRMTYIRIVDRLKKIEAILAPAA